jgi:2-haloacid dehalogenase
MSPPSPPAKPIHALAFDLFTLFDPRGVERRVAQMLGEHADLASTWKTRLFEYCWIRALSGRYVDFERLVHDALTFASDAHGVPIPGDVRPKLEAVFTELEPWPDTSSVLGELTNRGLRLAPLANYSPRMIEKLLGNAGIRDRFEVLISTDRARTYKPDPRAYALAEKAFGLSREQIAFAAFGGWDAAGGRFFGYPTFWVNRLNVPADELIAPDATGRSLAEFASWVARENGDASGR